MRLYESEAAIREYKESNSIIGYGSGVLFTARIKVEENSTIIYDDQTPFSLNRNKYDQTEVAIDWSGLKDESMRKMGLHGYYNTKYQRMDFDEGALIIKDGAITITIFDIIK